MTLAVESNNPNTNDIIVKLVMFVMITAISGMLLYKDNNSQIGIITFSGIVSFVIGLSINPFKTDDKNNKK